MKKYLQSKPTLKTRNTYCIPLVQTNLLKLKSIKRYILAKTIQTYKYDEAELEVARTITVPLIEMLSGGGNNYGACVLRAYRRKQTALSRGVLCHIG